MSNSSAASLHGTTASTYTPSQRLAFHPTAFVPAPLRNLGNREEGLKIWFDWRRSIIPGVLPKVLFFTGVSAIICIFKIVLGIQYALPNSVIPVLSIVVGLLLVFRTNTSYSRFYEARDLWGKLVSATRNLARMTLVYCVSPDPDDVIEKRIAFKLMQAFAVSVKHHLRLEHGTQYEDLAELIPLDVKPNHLVPPSPLFAKRPASVASTPGYSTKETPFATLRLDRAGGRIRRDGCSTHYSCGCVFWPLAVATKLTAFIAHKRAKDQIHFAVAQGMQGHVTVMLDTMTGLSRILTTPVPFTYNLHLKHTLALYSFALPFQLLADLQWGVIPIIFMVSFILWGLEAIALEIENPFGYDPSDLPLDEYVKDLRNEIQREFLDKEPTSVEQWIEFEDVSQITINGFGDVEMARHAVTAFDFSDPVAAPKSPTPPLHALDARPRRASLGGTDSPGAEHPPPPPRPREFGVDSLRPPAPAPALDAWDFAMEPAAAKPADGRSLPRSTLIPAPHGKPPGHSRTRSVMRSQFPGPSKEALVEQDKKH